MTNVLIFVLYLALICCCVFLSDEQHVGSYNIDPGHISISGFSSGGNMTVQMHVSYSSLFIGAGVIAGGPYHHATTVEDPTFPALLDPNVINVTMSQEITRTLSATGRIDPVQNLQSSKVFMIAGILDMVIAAEVVEKTYKFYKGFVDPSNLHLEYVNSAHSFPTLNYGGVCDEENPKFINNCSYNAAYQILNYIEENIVEPRITLNNKTLNLLKFNISETVEDIQNLTAIGLDEIAFLYVPTACEPRNISCKLHIALHGCTQGASTFGLDFVRHAGYNEVAAANDMIVIYPQAKIVPEINPIGCWDWIGSTGPNYATKHGPQIDTLVKMLGHIAGMKISMEN